MKAKQTITTLVFTIIGIAAIVTFFGIFSKDGPGIYTYESIRGETIEIYGRGIYQHMSAEVAIQGIAQDYVTLFIGIPLLMIALLAYRKNSLKGKFLLIGTLGYFLVTYLFYTAMGMYNIFFLAYVALLGLSFFAFLRTMLTVDLNRITTLFPIKAPTNFVGGFLIFNSIAIALLWLSIVVPPLLDGTVYPNALEHYTTLIVQGFDLGLLLPISFVSGLLLVRRTPMGWLAGTAYIVFLSIMMTALTGKVIAMAVAGLNVVPVIFIIPTFNLIAIVCAYSMIKNIKQ